MAGEINENSGSIPSSVDRFFNSVDKKLGFEKAPDIKVIYQYTKNDKPVLWVDLLTKQPDQPDFKAWYYSPSGLVDPKNIRTIPRGKTRSVIHFLPPEAEEAYKRQTEEASWLEDPIFREKKISIARGNIDAFIDFLNAIKEKKLGSTEYIIGETNYIMANFVLSLGFKRCWEEGYNPPDLTQPMRDEEHNYKFGISISELTELYDLNNQSPTKESVISVIRENDKKRKKS